jgi:predicted RNase H-like nuclease
MTVLGVDGCRGGWLGALVVSAPDGGPTVRWTWTADVAELLAMPADAVAIDIPIGLPEEGVRTCDSEARSLLGRRGVSVFAAPVRPVLPCTTYAEARAVLAARGGASMSAQAFGIVNAVREVDAALTPADESRVVEAHPEVAFCVMGGGPGLPPKRTASGAAIRMQLLQRWRPDVVDALTEVPVAAPLDDAVDALACAWVADRWRRRDPTLRSRHAGQSRPPDAHRRMRASSCLPGICSEGGRSAEEKRWRGDPAVERTPACPRLIAPSAPSAFSPPAASSPSPGHRSPRPRRSDPSLPPRRFAS